MDTSSAISLWHSATSTVQSKLPKKMRIVTMPYAQNNTRLASVYHKLAYLASLFLIEFEDEELVLTDAILDEYAKAGNLAAKAFAVVHEAYGVTFTLCVKHIAALPDGIDNFVDTLSAMSKDSLLQFITNKQSWIELNYADGAVALYTGNTEEKAKEFQTQTYFQFLQRPAPRTYTNVKLAGFVEGSTLFTLKDQAIEKILTKEELALFYSSATISKICVSNRLSNDDLPTPRHRVGVLAYNVGLSFSPSTQVHLVTTALEVIFEVKVPAALVPKLR